LTECQCQASVSQASHSRKPQAQASVQMSKSFQSYLLVGVICCTIIGVAVAATDYDKATNSDTTCTKGRLWLSETATGTVRAYNLDNNFGLGISYHTSLTQPQVDAH
jgi:hypothetical protein